jgi:hypothetical protein
MLPPPLAVVTHGKVVASDVFQIQSTPPEINPPSCRAAWLNPFSIRAFLRLELQFRLLRLSLLFKASTTQDVELEKFRHRPAVLILL